MAIHLSDEVVGVTDTDGHLAREALRTWEEDMKATPKCVIVTGRPGSGKSILSRSLRELLHTPLLSRDEIKEGFVTTFGISHDRLPENTNREATDVFFSAVQMFLERRVSVVVEAAFQDKVWSTVVEPWSRISDLYFILCEVRPELAAQRHLQRGVDDPSRGFFHGDHRVSVFKETGEVLPPGEYVPPSFDFPTLTVGTTEGYDPNLAAIRDFIHQERPPPVHAG